VSGDDFYSLVAGFVFVGGFCCLGVDFREGWEGMGGVVGLVGLDMVFFCYLDFSFSLVV